MISSVAPPVAQISTSIGRPGKDLFQPPGDDLADRQPGMIRLTPAARFADDQEPDRARLRHRHRRPDREIGLEGSARRSAAGPEPRLSSAPVVSVLRQSRRQSGTVMEPALPDGRPGFESRQGPAEPRRSARAALARSGDRRPARAADKPGRTVPAIAAITAGPYANKRPSRKATAA